MIIGDCGWYGTADIPPQTLSFKFLFPLPDIRNSDSPLSCGKFCYLVFIDKMTHFFNSKETLIVGTQEITFTWEECWVFTEQSSYEMGATLKEGPGKWVCFCFTKQPLSIVLKHSFSEILVYFKIQSHLLEFHSIWLFFFFWVIWIYGIRNALSVWSQTWILISLQEQERSWTKSKISIYFLRYLFIKMGICLLRYNLFSFVSLRIQIKWCRWHFLFGVLSLQLH